LNRTTATTIEPSPFTQLPQYAPVNPITAEHLKAPQKKRPKWRRLLRFRNRRRGTAIVDTPHGILVVSENGKTYNLPGGAAKGKESRQDAALRELEEETGLKATESFYLFEYAGRIQRDIKGGFFKDLHKVYLTKVSGVAKPKSEITHVAYTQDPNIKLSNATKRIIQKYFEERGQN
jgi:8-oxo-dGTP pyrophosphatase MutT (NUDIX family)